MSNKKLHNAQKAKCDEFYTRLEDIEQELNQYDKKYFKNKIIYMNCDNPSKSNFWVFFHCNFHYLGLKKIIATYFNSNYGVYYDGKNITDDENVKKYVSFPLSGNGDFRNDECKRLMQNSDIVVTNPPFSLFREFISQLIEYKKQFIIWGNNNAITYKSIFSLIRQNKIWLGFVANKK